MITLMSKVVTLYGKKTSMRLSDIEWHIFDMVCRHENIKRKAMLELLLKHHHADLNLTATVRLFILIYLFSRQQHLICSETSANQDILHNALQKLS